MAGNGTTASGQEPSDGGAPGGTEDDIFVDLDSGAEDGDRTGARSDEEPEDVEEVTVEDSRRLLVIATNLTSAQLASTTSVAAATLAFIAQVGGTCPQNVRDGIQWCAGANNTQMGPVVIELPPVDTVEDALFLDKVYTVQVGVAGLRYGLSWQRDISFMTAIHELKRIMPTIVIGVDPNADAYDAKLTEKAVWATDRSSDEIIAALIAYKKTDEGKATKFMCLQVGKQLGPGGQEEHKLLFRTSARGAASRIEYNALQLQAYVPCFVYGLDESDTVTSEAVGCRALAKFTGAIRVEKPQFRKSAAWKGAKAGCFFPIHEADARRAQLLQRASACAKGKVYKLSFGSDYTAMLRFYANESKMSKAVVTLEAANLSVKGVSAEAVHASVQAAIEQHAACVEEMLEKTAKQSAESVAATHAEIQRVATDLGNATGRVATQVAATDTNVKTSNANLSAHIKETNQQVRQSAVASEATASAILASVQASNNRMERQERMMESLQSLVKKRLVIGGGAGGSRGGPTIVEVGDGDSDTDAEGNEAGNTPKAAADTAAPAVPPARPTKAVPAVGVTVNETQSAATTVAQAAAAAATARAEKLAVSLAKQAARPRASADVVARAASAATAVLAAKAAEAALKVPTARTDSMTDSDENVPVQTKRPADDMSNSAAKRRDGAADDLSGIDDPDAPPVAADGSSSSGTGAWCAAICALSLRVAAAGQPALRTVSARQPRLTLTAPRSAPVADRRDGAMHEATGGGGREDDGRGGRSGRTRTRDHGGGGRAGCSGRRTIVAVLASVAASSTTHAPSHMYSPPAAAMQSTLNLPSILGPAQVSTAPGAWSAHPPAIYQRSTLDCQAYQPTALGGLTIFAFGRAHASFDFHASSGMHASRCAIAGGATSTLLSRASADCVTRTITDPRAPLGPANCTLSTRSLPPHALTLGERDPRLQCDDKLARVRVRAAHQPGVTARAQLETNRHRVGNCGRMRSALGGVTAQTAPPASCEAGVLESKVAHKTSTAHITSRHLERAHRPGGAGVGGRSDGSHRTLQLLPRTCGLVHAAGATERGGSQRLESQRLGPCGQACSQPLRGARRAASESCVADRRAPTAWTRDPCLEPHGRCHSHLGHEATARWAFNNTQSVRAADETRSAGGGGSRYHGRGALECSACGVRQGRRAPDAAHRLRKQLSENLGRRGGHQPGQVPERARRWRTTRAHGNSHVESRRQSDDAVAIVQGRWRQYSHGLCGCCLACGAVALLLLARGRARLRLTLQWVLRHLPIGRPHMRGAAAGGLRCRIGGRQTGGATGRRRLSHRLLRQLGSGTRPSDTAACTILDTGVRPILGERESWTCTAQSKASQGRARHEAQHALSARRCPQQHADHDPRRASLRPPHALQVRLQRAEGGHAQRTLRVVYGEGRGSAAGLPDLSRALRDHRGPDRSAEDASAEVGDGNVPLQCMRQRGGTGHSLRLRGAGDTLPSPDSAVTAACRDYRPSAIDTAELAIRVDAPTVCDHDLSAYAAADAAAAAARRSSVENAALAASLSDPPPGMVESLKYTDYNEATGHMRFLLDHGLRHFTLDDLGASFARCAMAGLGDSCVVRVEIDYGLDRRSLLDLWSLHHPRRSDAPQWGGVYAPQRYYDYGVGRLRPSYDDDTCCAVESVRSDDTACLELRFAADGRPYSLHEFYEYHRGYDEWDAAELYNPPVSEL